MKNICFITQCSLPIPTTKGGAVETLVEYLINENEKKGRYRFTVISVFDEKAKQKTENYKYTNFIYVKERSKRVRHITYQFYRVIKHLNIYLPFSWEIRDAFKVLETLEEQDAYIYEAGPTTQLPLLAKRVPKEKLYAHLHWDGLANPKKDKNFKCLLPVSDYIGNQWMKGAHCKKNKIIPFYNCAQIQRFTQKLSEEEKKELRSSLGIGDSNKVIVFTGRIVEEKGVRELLKAYEQLERQDVVLLIIGSANFGMGTNTPYEQEIQTLISSIKKKIIFTGFIHQTELYKYYNIATLAVMPSLFQDPAPLVCIETQATGVPLIATRVGGIPEYVGDGCAELVDVDENIVCNLIEAIEKMLDNDSLREEMAQKAVANAMKFSTENYYERFCKIMDQSECCKGE